MSLRERLGAAVNGYAPPVEAAPEPVASSRAYQAT